MLRKLIFILFLFLISCSDEKEVKLLYKFPSLSQGQLVDLKKVSETLEGFFITTDLSDLDSSWSERGFYLYVCIRFLNDETMNNKLKKSAIPLLIQVSNHPDKPEAESVLPFHPQTMKSGTGGISYYEERQLFQLTDSTITIRGMEYNIFDVEFNQKGKITNLSFLKKGTKLEDLERAVSKEEEEEQEEEADSNDESTNENNEESEEDKKELVLGVTAFAKQFSSSCKNWPILNYKNSSTLPEYLQVHYSVENGNVAKAKPATKTAKDTSSPQNSAIPPQTLIPEDAPFTPAE